jgi:hypothetical protein
MVSMRRLSLLFVGLAGCGEGFLAPFTAGELAADSTSGLVDSSSDASSDGDSSDGGESSSGGAPELPDDPLPKFEGEPLPDAPVGEWIWVDFPESRCRDGSSTGIGVRRGASDNLAFFFEGGGACFNGFTCLANDPDYTGDDFYWWKDWDGHAGIFNETRDDKPGPATGRSSTCRTAAATCTGATTPASRSRTSTASRSTTATTTSSNSWGASSRPSPTPRTCWSPA